MTKHAGSINETVNSGEKVVAVLKRDGKTIKVIHGKKTEPVIEPCRLEIELTIKDRLTGEVSKFEFKDGIEVKE